MCAEKISPKNIANDNSDLEQSLPFNAERTAGLAELLSEDACWTGEFLNRLEAGSIATMISCTASTEGISESVIMDMVASRFNADRIVQIRRADYNDVMDFLVHLDAKTTIN